MLGPAFAEGLEKAEALLYGRRTYLTMAGAWPERAGDPPPQVGGDPQPTG